MRDKNMKVQKITHSLTRVFPDRVPGVKRITTRSDEGSSYLGVEGPLNPRFRWYVPLLDPGELIRLFPS